MNVIKSFIFVLVLFLNNPLTAGCRGPLMWTSNGVNFIYSMGYDTAHATGNASFLIYVEGSNCGMYPLRNVKIYYNNTLVDSFPGAIDYNHRSFTLPEKPGHYKVIGSNFISPAYWEFDLLSTNNLHTDSVIGGPVGLPPLEKIDTLFSLFPNPATINITVFNSPEVIKKIMVCDVMGKTVYSAEINTNKINIPVTNFPAGIYLLSAYILPDKIIIKKFTVL